MYGRISLASIAVCCALASPASSATPVTTGPGTHPQVAVDATGAGYVTWIHSVAAASTFRYCKLPAAAKACTAPFSFADAQRDEDGGYPLLAPGGRVLLVEARGVAPNRVKLLWSSSDGGATFSGPTQIGTFAANGGNIAGRALYAPVGAIGLAAESIMTIGEIAATTAPFQATGTTAGTSPAVADLTPNVSADIALQGPALIAVLGDFVSVKSSIYIGPIPATLASLNAPASWSPPATIGPRSGANLETSLVSGPGGVYLGYAVPSATPGFADFVMRRAGGAGWGPPTVVAAKASKPDLHEDPSGRLHALWTDTAGLHYRYTTNAANTVWSAPQTIATGVSFGFPRLAVNADGKGWAVWGDGTNVQAVPLSKVVSTYSGATRPTTSSGFGGTYNLRVPKGCVSPGQRFRVTLTWKRQKRKGNLFVKVRRSDFYLGSRVLRRDTKAPYVHTYTVAVTQAPGSNITLRARAFIKVRRGTSPKKSIRATVRVCS